MTISIDDLPIPLKAIELLKREGITTLFPPQEAAINAGVLNRKNMVLSVPTAAGKTLVAELAIIKNLFEHRGKALYLVPLRALAQEKYKEFKKYEQLNLRIGITTGDYDSTDSWLENYDIIITTNEKADSLLRHHVSWLKKLAIIVSDEVHLMQDYDRGPTLEVVLTRLINLNPNAQMLALSATIKNAQDIAEWLDAELVLSTWRPVKLYEGVLYQTTIKYANSKTERVKRYVTNNTVNLTLNKLISGGQILIFTNTRKSGVSLAEKIATKLDEFKDRIPIDEENLKQISEEILHATEVTQVSKLLSNLIKKGVAFHHAGLHSKHREIIEQAFRKNYLKVICATPTLAAGVNLPARIVIIDNFRRYDTNFGYKPIPVLEYKQMVGRAGRPKYDKEGFAITVARRKSEIDQIFDEYINGEPEQIVSRLNSETVLRKHILASIASKFTRTTNDLMEFLGSTFYGHFEGKRKLKSTVINSVEFLEENVFIVKTSEHLEATKFGERVSQLYIDPNTAIIFRDAIEYAMTEDVALTDFSFLHVITITPDMPTLNVRQREYDIYEEILDKHMDELLVPIPSPISGIYQYEEFLNGIKTAMLLLDWINEKPEDDILDKYGIGSGDLLRFKELADWLLYSFGELIRLNNHNTLWQRANDVRLRVKYGVKRELLDLVKITNIGRIRARALYNAGYTSIEALKKANEKDLMKIPAIGPKLAKQIVQLFNP
ncbi:MAG: DEAD/DEAH box helicase [Candidatus Odinarchaeota archaeon]|nr:DEAD/DEAH box helicase [Candidatus Odinarchaeota archaeon]